MKIPYFIAWLFFAIGIAFQFLHFPFGGFLLFLSLLFLWGHALVYLWQNRKNLPRSVFYLAIAALTSYIICRFQYWSLAKPVYYAAILLTLSSLFLSGKEKRAFHWTQFLLIAYFAFIYFLAYTPSYKIFYLTKLNTVLNNDTRDLDYRAWDRYSWFLYLRDKQDEALEANKKAKDAVNASIKNGDELAHSYVTAIDLHTLQIKEKKWETYP